MACENLSFTEFKYKIPGMKEGLFPHQLFKFPPPRSKVHKMIPARSVSELTSKLQT